MSEPGLVDDEIDHHPKESTLIALILRTLAQNVLNFKFRTLDVSSLSSLPLLRFRFCGFAFEWLANLHDTTVRG
jgi:hypothetical protein